MVYFSVPTSEEPVLPSNSHRPRKRWPVIPGVGGRYGSVVLFLGTAALTGIVFHLLAFSALNRYASTYNAPPPELEPPHRPGSILDYEPELAVPPPEELVDDVPVAEKPPPRVAPHRPANTEEWIVSAPRPDYHELSLEALRDQVATTKGYFARDFSLGLGWNNMRYIIEAAALQATLLNRTLILPSFVYARACEYDIHVCAEYATMVNKGDAIGWAEWRELPIEQQMGWRLPTSLMLNLTHLREKHSVILLSDYLRLHGRPASDEHSNGAWHRQDYISTPNVFETDTTKTPSQFVVNNHWYDPQGVNRVDFIPEEMKVRGKYDESASDEQYGRRGDWPEQPETAVSRRLSAALPEHQYYMDFATAKSVLQDGDSGAVWDLSTDEKVIDLLRHNGWEVLYTFLGALGADYTKTVVNPLDQVVRRSSIRGWVDEYDRETADVLVLAGETHLYRKPGAMRFSTEAGRRSFQDTVLNYLVPVDAVNELASKLATRMYERTEGRLWMGAHMRRGDFVRLGWAMEKDPETHVRRVKDRLGKGREFLESLKSRDIQTYDIPDIRPNPDLLSRPPPRSGDAFYVATDEREPDAMKVIQSNGAVFLKDLLTQDDLRDFGWSLMITDYRAVVEQHLLAHSSFFYAHAMSSVAGGIVNMRAVAGADRHTSLLD